jgi:hypothetical protein
MQKNVIVCININAYICSYIKYDIVKDISAVTFGACDSRNNLDPLQGALKSADITLETRKAIVHLVTFL